MIRERDTQATPSRAFKQKVLRSEELFSGEREVLIEHNRNYYRLMITRAGKLILNK